MKIPVAVSAPRRTDDGRERVALNVAYVRALTAAGLVPLVVPPHLDPEDPAAVLGTVRGLVLTGGEDVDPRRYGAPPHPKLGASDPLRDATEIALLRAARETGTPILAICRGIQILNVALGGSLYQDLPTERPGPIDHHDPNGRHGLQVEPSSLLGSTLGVASAQVNSRHHQAIRDLAPGLTATAWAEDGVIEAVEFSGEVGGGAEREPWMLAVQWHPEDMTERALFEGFARAVATGSESPSRR